MIKDTLLSKRFAIIWLPTLLCLLSCILLNSGPASGAVTQGGITTVAGNGGYCYSGDGGPATSAALDDPCGLAVDTSGNLYIADSDNNRVRKVNSAGIITTVAGKGRSNNSSALLGPRGLTLDTSGNLYVADTWNCRVIKLSPSGAITTVAGSGFWASMYEGEGGPATRARILPDSVAVDAAGDLYFDGINCVRKAAAPIPPYPATGQSVIVFTAGQPSYTVDGQSFAMNAAPIISNGRLLVPVRYLSDALGVETAWETSGTGAVIQIQIFTCNVVALLNIGSTAMDLSIRKDMEPGVSKTTQMDVAPAIIDGRTYMAARYLTDAFGCTINWNGAAQTITVLQQPM